MNHEQICTFRPNGPLFPEQSEPDGIGFRFEDSDRVLGYERKLEIAGLAEAVRRQVMQIVKQSIK